MTVERKIVVGLEDLKALIFECKNCGARVVVSPERAEIPRSCPACPQQWLPTPPPKIESTASVHANFVEAVGKIRGLESSSGNQWPKFRVLLEFDEPELAGRG
jgi:hypothetical protein